MVVNPGGDAPPSGVAPLPSSGPVDGPRPSPSPATRHVNWGKVIVILIIVNLLTGVRVSQPVEVEGLDINLHGEVVP